MHELRIAEDLTDIVLETATKEHLSKVSRISIIFGQLVSIVPEIFEFAFREAVKGTVASDAELSVEVLPVKLKCKACGNDFLLDRNLFACSVCNSTDIDIIQGKELFIKSIEGI
jgi:hydrogenase nickel incorporation protein HypA/HybF